MAQTFPRSHESPEQAEVAAHEATAAEAVDAQPVELGYSSPAHEGSERRRWPMPIPLRLVYVAMGVAGPAAGLIVNADLDDSVLAVDWQNGRPLAWLTLATLPEVFWPLAPFLIGSWAAMLAICIAPRRLVGSRLVRAGLWLGVLLGIEYTFVVAAGFTEGDGVETLASAMPNGGIGGVVGFLGLLFLHWLARFARLHRPVRLTMFALAGVAGLVLTAGTLVEGLEFLLNAVVSLLLPLIFAAPLSAVAHGLMLWHLAHVGVGGATLGATLGATPQSETPGRIKLWLAAIVLLALHAIAWVLVRIAAGAVYARLPTVEPAQCFVATAAARSRASAASGHRQLGSLRAFERRLAQHWPGLHGLMRWFYNRTGPLLASAITSPQRAGLAHCLLRPIEWLAATAAGSRR